MAEQEPLSEEQLGQIIHRLLSLKGGTGRTYYGARTTQSYRDAINEKNVQVQASLQAQAKVAQSRAEANQVIAAARGEAEAIKLKGRALRSNPEVLRLEAINKLNPAAQIVFCSSGDCPSFLPAAVAAKAVAAPAATGKDG